MKKNSDHEYHLALVIKFEADAARAYPDKVANTGVEKTPIETTVWRDGYSGR